ncbi:MAG: carboxypeptidase regulatory-like domain-containing protein [Planctomycetia bacterium]
MPRRHRHFLLLVGLVAAIWPLADRPAAAEPPPTARPLPWQPDYAAAVSRAQADHRHLVVLFTARDDEACRRLETETLRDPLIEAALADLVRVRVEQDAGLAARLEVKDRPTLLFVNPFTGGVLHRVGGEKSVELLAREIVHARRAIGLELPAALAEVAARMFAFDDARAEELLEAGDAAGLEALVAPAAADDSRPANYLVATVTLPVDMVPDDVRVLAGTDCLEGSCDEFALPATRLVLGPFPRGHGAAMDVRITAPGCRLTSDTVRFAGPAPGTAVQVRRYAVERLTAAEEAVLSGRVERPDGSAAAAAIVRIDDWFDLSAADDTGPAPAVTRTDHDGRFTFRGVSPGRWLVRAEAAGGEREQVVELEPTGRAECRLALEPVTTVGLRWVLQTRERSQDLTGPGTRSGDAFVSVAGSRITLARGMRLRTADPCDLSLAQTPLDDDTLPVETRRALAALPAGTPVWYLLDAAYTADLVPISGLHRDPRPFGAIHTVHDGEPLPQETLKEWDVIGPILPRALAAARERGNFFELLRGVPVRPGDVFTLRCVTSNCFAKLEVTDVTIVAGASRRQP